ncbi:hypothetical protein GGE07_004800 [Sinorhizobium terangae]|uniref:hypothetical protein n=1 Tax=Sinorhizobium terangae TaxID=110322 RepID=UPI00160C8D8D|nr:hypothetical protein [Sinorhizobium terangae]MBB4188124.1 hypothetical protein [Sinorhizobium terangae]
MPWLLLNRLPAAVDVVAAARLAPVLAQGPNKASCQTASEREKDDQKPSAPLCRPSPFGRHRQVCAVDDAAEFQRFYAALRTYVLPVWFITAAVLMVILVATATRKVDLGPQERVINVCFWGSSVLLAAALAYAFAVVKLAGTP